jgi:NDP-sugar pyrophosphorylase family protein
MLTWAKVFKNGEKKKLQSLDVPVVIMAGGKGTRLEPFTYVLPKPLVPIHEKPVIEHLLESFTDVGVHEFIITLNYKARIMKAFFEELNPSYTVDFVVEQEPLGTAGSLKFLEGRFDLPFMVTNCDIIIKTDYLNLYKFHQKNNYDITLVASMKNYTIPYGTCELNADGHLEHINEKPEYDFLVNTGLYVLNSNVLELIPAGKFYHITHLIEDVKNSGKRVGVYPIADDAWIDVGQWAEYKKAVERL